MALETLTFAVDAGVALITINRPDRMNAINQAMKADLAEVFDHLIPADASIRAVIVSGAGEKAFCAGADIKDRGGEDPTAAEFVARQRKTYKLFDRIAAAPVPVIAAINGAALGGGCEIALCCDIRLMSRTAKIGLTEINLGIIPAGGGTQRLPRVVGAGVAKRLLFTGAVLTADQALAIGLVDEIVEPPELLTRAQALAALIATKPPLAVRHAKHVVDLGLETDIATGMEAELHAAAILFTSEDKHEGMRAFLEKRAPVFKGR